MDLSFKPQFKEPINQGTKIHSIREDKHNRWKPGRLLQGVTGARSKRYNVFFKSKCVSTQHIEITWLELKERHLAIFIDRRKLYPTELHELAINDGFKNLHDLKQWFNKDFKGKIIHWTNFKY